MLIYTDLWKDCLQYLKSGMPVDVLIPAPECTTMYCDSFIHWASVSTLVFSSSGLSNSCKHTHFRLMTWTANSPTAVTLVSRSHKQMCTVTNCFKLLFYIYIYDSALFILYIWLFTHTSKLSLAELLASCWTYTNLIVFVNPPLFLFLIHCDPSIHNSNHQ